MLRRSVCVADSVDLPTLSPEAMLDVLDVLDVLDDLERECGIVSQGLKFRRDISGHALVVS